MEKQVNHTRTGPMKPEDEARVQKASEYIIRHVDGKKLLGTLIQDLVIGDHDKKKVTSGKTIKDHTRSLLDILKQRGPEAYGGLLRALRSNGYEIVADVIEEKRTAKTDLSTKVEKLQVVTQLHGEKLSILEERFTNLDANRERPTNDVDFLIKQYEEAMEIKDQEIEDIQLQLSIKDEELRQLRGELTEEKARLNAEIADLQLQLDNCQQQFSECQRLYAQTLQENEILRDDVTQMKSTIKKLQNKSDSDDMRFKRIEKQLFGQKNIERNPGTKRLSRLPSINAQVENPSSKPSWVPVFKSFEKLKPHN